MESIISLKNISKTFYEEQRRSLPVLRDITLEIGIGEIFILLGPSGAGKSTLLRIMSGLEKEYEGEITLGEGITHKDTNFIFQQFALLPWLSVEENVALGLIARGREEEKIKRRVEHELRELGLEHFARHRIHELSGGMRQRVGIARALATDPKLIFMDEPFSELDSFTASALRKEFLDIWRARKLTIVMVSHNIEETIEMADRIAVLTPIPGRIEAIVENTLPRPRPKRSEGFYKLEDQLLKLVKV